MPLSVIDLDETDGVKLFWLTRGMMGSLFFLGRARRAPLIRAPTVPRC